MLVAPTTVRTTPGVGNNRSSGEVSFYFFANNVAAMSCVFRWPNIGHEDEDVDMKFDAERRDALVSFGAGLIVSGTVLGEPANAAVEGMLVPANAKSLREFSRLEAGIVVRVHAALKSRCVS